MFNFVATLNSSQKELCFVSPHLLSVSSLQAQRQTHLKEQDTSSLFWFNLEAYVDGFLQSYWLKLSVLLILMLAAKIWYLYV